MALASAQIGSTQNGYYTNDRPTMLATPVYEDQGDTRWNADGLIATADDTDTDYPTQAAYDGNCSTLTRGAQQQRFWHFIAHLQSGHRTVDGIFAHILDVDSDVDTTTMTAYVSDDGASWEQIDNISETLIDGRLYRFFFPVLQDSGSDSGDDQRQWTGALYVRLTFDAGAGQVCRPQITELIAGEQQQMQHNPLYPWDDNDGGTSPDDTANTVFTSRSGIRTVYQDFSGAHVLDGIQWVLSSTTEAAKPKALRSATMYGARPFVWCPDPYSAPNTAYLMMMRDPNEFRLPRRTGLQWEWTVDAVEQGGSFLGDE